MTPALTRLMQALRDELSDWSTTSGRLEAVIGDILEGRSLGPGEIAAVQALDGLTQHLGQLAQLCGDLGGTAGCAPEETDERIQTAVRRLNLAGLGHRLGDDRARASPSESSEAELW